VSDKAFTETIVRQGAFVWLEACWRSELRLEDAGRIIKVTA
jgi:hypothetical protein